MAIRKGLGKGTGKGYRNIIGKDPRVHSDSGKGRKQPQRLKGINMINRFKKIQDRNISNRQIGIIYQNKNISVELFRDILWGKTEEMNVIVRDKNKPSPISVLGKDILVKHFSSEKEARAYAEKYMKSKDSDMDGKLDEDDCRPFDPTKQDFSAKEILKKEYGSSKNFITPDVEKIGKITGNIAFELSSGRGFEEGTAIYGVSVVLIDDKGQTHRDIGLSHSFSDKKDALGYIEQMKKSKPFTKKKVLCWDEKGTKKVGFMVDIYKSDMNAPRNIKGQYVENSITFPYPIAKSETVVEIQTTQEGTKIIPADKIKHIGLSDQDMTR